MRGDRTGETEVCDLDLAASGDEYVLWLQVAVDDAGLMRCGYRCDDRQQQVEGALGLHRCLAGDHVARGGAFDVLHHHVGPLSMPWSNTETTLMRQPRCGARLAIEAVGEVLSLPRLSCMTLIATVRVSRRRSRGNGGHAATTNPRRIRSDHPPRVPPGSVLFMVVTVLLRTSQKWAVQTWCRL